MDSRITELESKLSDLDPQVRRQALAELVALVPPAAEQEVANLHCHSFYSFNAYGHSPSSLAWLARRQGWRVAGIVDFDVLDGVAEFLSACDLAGVRGAAGIETRVVVPELASREINSPGEPGIAYHMGIGFTSGRVAANVAPILKGMREQAARRNREMLARVNDYLAPVTIDYERDVLPLTPGDNPTERHMLVAYMAAAGALPDPAGFWADRLHLSREEAEALLADPPKLQGVARAKLMKRGGVGYVQPGPESFPTLDEFHRLIVACGALPCAAWLDGTSAGESALDELLQLWLSRGVAVVNIVPDRNWNVADPDLRRLKVARLHELARAACEADLPIIAGTEMNSPGQKLVDDLSVPALAPLREAFLDGAYVVYGHTALQRACRMGYGSAWAEAHLPTRRERNAFYAQVGRRVPVGQAGVERLAGVDAEATPVDVLARLD